MQKKHKKAVLKQLDDAPLFHEEWCRMVTGEARAESEHHSRDGGGKSGRKSISAF